MAGLIPQSFIDELLTRTDIVEVIDSRVKLKKTGKNYSACCPFHNEKSPSFSVSPDKQFYHCFGCGVSGSAIKFLMEYEGLSFPDSVGKLAQSVGLDVPKEQASQQEIQKQQQQQPLFELMQQATEFFEQMLRSHPERNKAVDYLKGRGLSGKAAQFFSVGYAPAGWDNLQDALAPNADKNLIKQLISCGMLIEREDGRTYDRFRDRVMFPIRDLRGRTIAFGGRVLTDEKPKYLNSPETPIFHKGNELYGLYEARKIRQKLTRLLIVEGYMDVVALAEHGIHYAVATLGTATSEHHLRRLFKIVPEVIFCFDGDNAGRTAAARAMETVLPLLEDGLQVRFLFLPDGEDPDTLIRQEGKQGFEHRVNTSTHLPEFLFNHLKQQVDVDSLHGKARLDQLAAPLIYRLPHGILRTLMEKRLDKELGTESVALERLATDPNPASFAEPVIAQPVETNTVDNSALASLVQRAIFSVVQKPSLASAVNIDDIDVNTSSVQEQLLLKIIRKLQESPQESSIGLLIQWTGKPELAELRHLADANSLGITPALSEVSEVIKLIGARKLAAELALLNQRFTEGQELNKEEQQRMRELRVLLHGIQRKRNPVY